MLEIVDELRCRPRRARPLARPEQEVEGLRAARVREFGPHEHLRHDENRLLLAALQLEQRLDEIVAGFEPAPAGGAGRHVEHAGRPLEEHGGGATVRERVFELVRGKDVGARQNGVEPALAHRVQDPEPEIVDETDLRELVALREVVEGEEVDEVQAAQHVDDRAALRQRAHLAHPGFVDLNGVEEPPIQRTQNRVGLVGLGELSVGGHGGRRAGSYSSSTASPLDSARL